MLAGTGNLSIAIKPNNETFKPYDLWVVFPCGKKVAVNSNTEYALRLMDKEQAVRWACELLMMKEEVCVIIKLAREL